MNSSHVFRLIRKEEIPEMFSLILRRMEWMNEKGVRQWNVSGYDKTYPQSYYEEKQQQGRLYVLADADCGEILCAGALFDHDDYWPDDPPAIYIHHFVSRPGCSGVGTIFLRHAEQYALHHGKDRLRLDSAENNPSLAHYYEKNGFVSVGNCTDGPYRGILREKMLI